MSYVPPRQRVEDRSDVPDTTFRAQVIANQDRLSRDLRLTYDFIVCGSGSSGSVVAGRLAQHSEVSVLLLEAGASDESAAVSCAAQWPTNLESERDWNFRAEPNRHLNGRATSLNMGKVLGGGASINVMIWSRGHRSDWDFFASEACDEGWNYESVLDIYRRVEDLQGPADKGRRGQGGPVFVQPAPDPNPIAPAFLDAARAQGIETYDSPNGRMMEGQGGAALIDVRVRGGQRLSIFRSYTYPMMARPNLTVLTNALVTRVIFDGKRAIGVEFLRQGKLVRAEASSEVVLSMGAIQTPKLLMQCGIGDAEHLKSLDIPVICDLPGVGQNFQDHTGVASCVWEYREPLPPRNNGAEATMFWRSDSTLETPDIQIIQGEIPFASAEIAAKFTLPPGSWVMFPGCIRPHSRGHLRLKGAKLDDPIEIHSQALSDERDFTALTRAVEFCRDLGSSSAFAPFIRREIAPGPLTKADLTEFIRNAAVTVWHPSGTAKMGQGPDAVVDGRLLVYGMDNLRIADASVMPRVTTGNTMAPCVVIAEKASQAISRDYHL